MGNYFNEGDAVYVAQADLFDNSLLSKKGVIKTIYKDSAEALILFEDITLSPRKIELCMLEK